MSITKFAIISAAILIGGSLIIKRFLSSEGTPKKRKIYASDIDEISYDTLISDIKKIYQENEAAYRDKSCKIQILNSKPTAQLYAILKKEDPSCKMKIGKKCVSTVLFANGEIEYIKIYSYKSMDKGLMDVFSSGRDIFEQEIE